MSACTAEEIAEKRRIALEKLAAKKQRLSNTLSTETKIGASVQQPIGNTSTGTFLKNQHNNTQGVTVAPTAVTPNQKSTPTGAAVNFLNDLKRYNVGDSARNARDVSHPYQRNTRPCKQNGAVVKSTSNGKAQQPSPVFTTKVSCKVYMISKTRFAVLPSCYHAKLIDVFKSVPSKYFDRAQTLWSFGLVDYERLQDLVFSMNPEVVIGTIPRSVITLCRTPAREYERSCLTSIESKLAQKLLPFQQEGVCFAIAQHGRLMICDDMGLGKTYQALAVADFYKESWPLLICTTASIRVSWANHVRELLPRVPVHYVQVLTSAEQDFHDAKILITSYSLMDRNVEQLLQCKFGFIIFDESHTLKNSKTKCAIVAERLAKQARHVVLLSGTPALSRPLELFTQLHMIDRKFMTYMEFTSRYCDGKHSRYGWDASGQSNLEELRVVLELKFMIRRTKDAVLPQLAEKHRETVVLDPELITSNTDTDDNMAALSKDFSASKGRKREEILFKFYSTTAVVKTRAVCAYLKNIVKENIKFIVFAHHLVMLDAITDCLQKLNVNFVRIDGSTKNESRGEYINVFQTKSSCTVAVLSLRACNAGITLTAAEMIIFAELDWNPSTLAQAESRAHRIGQSKPIVCRYLMAAKTADDIIWNMLKDKQDVLTRAGLFSDNLQDATYTAAPTGSHKIENSSSPAKKENQLSVDESESPADTLNSTENTENNSASSNNLSKELENIDDFFQDDDEDDTFRNLMC